MKKKLREATTNFTLEEGAGGRPFARVTLIRAGMSKNGNYYPADVLAEATRLYEGKPCLLDHSWSPSVRDIAGWYRNVRWNRTEKAIEAELHFLDTQAGRLLLELAREQYRLKSTGQLPEGESIFGFSHVVFAEAEQGDPGVEGYDQAVIVSRIVEVLSVDAVVFPAAGGTLDDMREEGQQIEAKVEGVEPGKTCANAEAIRMAFKEAIKKVMEEEVEEGPTRYRNLPLAPRNQPWDGARARRRLRRWASSDGSGDKDTIDWRRYRWGFFWYDSDNPDSFGSYKLPFADIVDGMLKAVPRGVFAAAAVVQGARGGVDIPPSDIPGVKRHIEAYYRKMAREWDEPDLVPPWEREAADLTDEEAAAFIEAFGLDAFVQTFGYTPLGDSATEEVEKEGEDMAKKKEEKKAEGATPEPKTERNEVAEGGTDRKVIEQELREQIAAEFAGKLQGMIEERNQLLGEIEQLKKKIEAYEAEKREAERKEALENLFKKHGIEGAAREAIESIVADMDLEKAEKVIALAAGQANPKKNDQDLDKRTSEASEDDPVKIGLEFAKEMFGVEVDA